MTEGIYSWIQSLACYFVILSAVLNLLPDNSYKKYVQYYMGLLLILVLLSPLLKLGEFRNRWMLMRKSFGRSWRRSGNNGRIRPGSGSRNFRVVKG